ncbi:MAG: hypothetical protein H7Z14_15240 [Anaerolineae bacterium]|nr:hypothetical protein [Phycisphaerae bacterium]
MDAVREGRSALAVAARMGGNRNDLGIAQLLIDQGANPNGPGVMRDCRVELLPVLIERGGHVDGNHSESNPLLCAIAGRTKQDKALALLAANANPNVRDTTGTTPLIEAARHGRGKVFERLMRLGADTLAVDQTGRSALRHAAEALAGASVATGSAVPVLRRIVRTLRDGLPAQPEDGILASLALADVDDIRRRLDKGLDPNTRIAGLIGLLGVRADTLLKSVGGFFGLFGNTIDQPKLDHRADSCSLLMWAVALEHIELIRLLIERGADANLKTADGVSAAEISLRTRSPRIREMLGTGGIERKGLSTHVGNRQPSLKTEQRIDAGRTPADRLAVDLERARDYLKHVAAGALHVPDGQELANKYGFASSVSAAWTIASAHHVLEQPEEARRAAKMTLRLADLFFTSPQDIADRRESYWMDAFRAALGAASVLNRNDRMCIYAAWVAPDAPRGGRSPMYNKDYFIWPLLQIWSRAILAQSAEPRFAKMITAETARWPKLLLAAWGHILQSDGTQFEKAIRRCIEQHRTKAFWKGSGVADRIVSPELCFLIQQARTRGLKFTCSAQIADWIIVSGAAAARA